MGFDSFKSEFRSKFFGFAMKDDETSELFWMPRSSFMNHWLVLLWRMLGTAYLIAFMAISVSNSSRPNRWIIFFTSINYIFTLLYFVLALLVSLVAVYCRRKFVQRSHSTEQLEMGTDVVVVRTPTSNSPVLAKLSFLEKVYWAVSSIALNQCLTVTIVYWVFLVPNDDETPFEWYLRIDRHGIVFLWVLVDRLLTRAPVRLLHFIYPMFSFFIYFFCLNIPYSVVNDELIYTIIDIRNKPATTLGMIFGTDFIIIPLFQFLIWLLFYKFNCCMCCKSED